ncbi:electron transfer flavoprotein subunit alpha/FixB family protein [Streptomyces acidicola]|uniref:electron transfer flavoprotein subunit alpha/FixB family protein n=1 Tax=Streptomyces acidicola TaxID=2596892 RepID=UPI003815B3A2
MQRIWILAETRESRPLPIVTELAAAARMLASTVEAVTWGGDGSAVADELGRHGVTTVMDVGELGASFAGPSVAAAIAQALSSGAEAPDAILIGATYDGRDVAARLSARLDLPLITNVVGLEEFDGTLVSSHALVGAEKTATARFTGQGPGIFVVRSKSFEASEVGGPSARVAPLAIPDLGQTELAQVVRRHVDPRNGPRLEDAGVVVAGGRGLGSADGFGLIEELATLLQGAPAASRAAVDAGWVPYSYQVGQTGKIVKPDVYLAFGISGAVQHLVGMRDAKRIIAVDQDPAAPIFQVADLGVVGDVHEVLPRLIEALKNRTNAA